MKKEFSIKFRGVRGSYPTCDRYHLKYGGNTACIEINVGGETIVLDAGTGIIGLGNSLVSNYLTSGATPEERKPIKASVLLSHVHLDHLLGFPFFKPIHVETSSINVFGSSTYDDGLAEDIAQVVYSKGFPLDLNDIKANLTINDITETDVIILSKDKEPVIKRLKDSEALNTSENDVVITCKKSHAHPRYGVMMYKISYKGKSVVYATDKETYIGGDMVLAKFARDCDLLIHDTQYTTEDYCSAISPKQGFGHSTFEMAIDTMERANAKQLACFHYEPDYDDEKIDMIAEMLHENTNIIFAKEGMELKV